MLPHFLALYPLSIWLKALLDMGFGFVQQALIIIEYRRVKRLMPNNRIQLKFPLTQN